jgi:hypothetical protein
LLAHLPHHSFRAIELSIKRTMYPGGHLKPQLWWPMLLSSVLLAALSPSDSQTIAALHPSSIPASAMRITVFGSGFNVSRDYSCSISSPARVAAACQRTLPRSPTIIEFSCVMIVPCFCLSLDVWIGAQLGRALEARPRCSFLIRRVTCPLRSHCSSSRHGQPSYHLLHELREALLFLSVAT